MTEYRSLLERAAAKAPALDIELERVLRRRDRKRRNDRIRAGALAIVLMVIGAIVFVRTLRSDPIPIPTGQPGATSSPSTFWSPVRAGDNETVHRVRSWWDDPVDSPEGWVDVKRVRFSDNSGEPWWSLELAAKPPSVADREPGLLMAYGVVLETTGDGIADYVVGIDDGGPERGDFRVWLTDLATGQTDEQIGPPYGFPIEFIHPLERDSNGRDMVFWFLRGAAPPGVSLETVRFYAWASAAKNGEIFTTDFAPNAGWLRR